MLVYRTIAKRVFWDLDSFIMQNLSDILPLFCTPAWPSHHVSENQEYRLLTEFEGPHCKLRNSKKQQNLSSIWPKVATFRYAFLLFQFMARVPSTRVMN